MSKMNLPSVPRSADRDTTVFLQSLKKAIEMLHVGGKTELSEGAKSYVLRIDKKTREDLVGVIGDEAGVGAILDKIKGQITESELSVHLGERIAKITSNENAISEERLQRVADVLAVNQAIAAEALARVDAINTNSALLLKESETRLAEDEAITRNLDLLHTQINGDGTSSSSSIVQQLTTVSNKADTNARDISGLTSKFDTEMYSAEGIITRNAETAASASAANASDISGVFAQVNPKMAGDTDGWAGDDSPANLVGVWSERSARIEEGIHTAERFDAMTARVDGNAAAISTESKIRADAIKAVAERTDTLRADYDKNAGVVQTQIKAVADNYTALSQRTDTVQSTVDGHTASIETAQRSINGINASWSIKADVNGVVGGLGVANDGRTVDFIMRASSFAIQGPSGSKSVPFVSYPNGTVIDGVPIPAGNYLEDTFIRRASIDTLDIKGNAVTVPVSAFTEAAIAVGDIYTTIQSLPVPADMGHTMLNFNAIFNFPGYARVQSILCRIVKGGAVIADNIEVFFSEARSESRVSSAVDIAHSHGATFNGYGGAAGTVTVQYGGAGNHSHTINVANDNRNAGSFALSRHDSTGAAGIYELQMRVSNGGTANISQRYIHAITMRR